MNYFTKTFITDILTGSQVRLYISKKEKYYFQISVDYPPINIRAFLLTFWVFWAFWNDKRKIEKQQKNEICNRNADVPC